MSNITGDSRSFSSGEDEVHPHPQQQQHQNLLHHKQPQLQLQQHFNEATTRSDNNSNSNGSSSHQLAPPAKKKRNLPGTPDPSAEVIALSPTTLMATNRFICEICNKGFQRDQNLQLHRRGHNLPWKLKQRTSAEIRKRVYICPETTCVHHNPARALGDLTGIKKHFCRKHGEKKWKCDKCAKKYAVQSDWKAHSKTCGTREYKCDCGTIFSRRDSFITHRAFCDALAEENNKVSQGMMPNLQGQVSDYMSTMPINNPTMSTPHGMSEFTHSADSKNPLKSHPLTMSGGMFSSNSAGSLYNGLRSSSCLQLSPNNSSSFDGLHDSKSNQQVGSGPGSGGSAHMSATALLQKAAQMGATASSNINSPMMQKGFPSSMSGPNQGPYGGITSYENMQSQQTDQSQLIGIDGESFINQFLHNKAPQEMSPQFVDGDMGAFSGTFMGGGGNQHHGYLKTTENENGNTNKPSSTTLFQGKPSRNPSGPSRFSGSVGGGGGGDVLTVDFLGVGGSRSHRQHRQQQEQDQQEEDDELEYDDRIQGLHQYQQQVSQEQTAIEKPMWDV